MAIKEIGGYFGLEQLNSQEYYADLVAVNTARNALVYLIKAKKIEKIYLPYFLCESVANVCKRENCHYEYYSIDRNFLPMFDKKLGNNEFLYIVNFYGQLQEKYIVSLKARFQNIILDNVQAFFQKPLDGIDTIYSCRKYFGVPDGAYLSTKTFLEYPLEIDASRMRMTHILGRFETNAAEFYQNFKENDHAFENIPLRAMSALTHNILGAIDYEKVKQKRNENYKILSDGLGHLNGLSLKEHDAPYAYPFYCKNGLKLKKRLAEEKIYVATLWPNVLCLDGTQEKDFAENILPLPCDQRYDSEDMKRIVWEISKCRI